MESPAASQTLDIQLQHAAELSQSSSSSSSSIIVTLLQSAPPVTTPPSTDRTIFPFFQLPRELRDQIYDSALLFKRKLPSQHQVRLRVRRSPEVNLLLVNHQFGDEYSTRARRSTTLVVVDRDEFLGQTLELPPPAIKPFVTQLEVHLALACNDVCHVHPQGCRVKRELRMHRRWIADAIKQMRGVETVVIKIVLDPHDNVAHCEALLEAEQFRLTGLEGVTNVQVFHCEYETGARGWNFNRRRSIMMNWDDRRRHLVRLQKTDNGNGDEAVGLAANIDGVTAVKSNED